MIQLPRLYAIVDQQFISTTEELIEFAQELVAGGCTVLQYRSKSCNARLMLEQALELRRRSRAWAPAPHVHAQLP